MGGDPGNIVDPTGLVKEEEEPDSGWRCGDGVVRGGVFKGLTVQKIMTGDRKEIGGNDDLWGYVLMARLMWNEAGEINSFDEIDPGSYLEELTAIGTAVINQWDIANGRLFVQDREGNPIISPLGSNPPTSLEGIVYKMARDGGGRLFTATGHLRNEARVKRILDQNILDGHLVLDYYGGMVNSLCEGIFSAISRANGLASNVVPRVRPNGRVIFGWDRSRGTYANTYEFRTKRMIAHTFYAYDERP